MSFSDAGAIPQLAAAGSPGRPASGASPLAPRLAAPGRPRLPASGESPSAAQPTWPMTTAMVNREVLTTPPPVAPFPPANGGRILVLQRKYFDLMLAGQKSLEIRCSCLSPGKWHVGHSGEIYGYLVLGQGYRIESEDQWSNLRPQHQHPSVTRPYKRTCALPVISNFLFSEPLPYVHKAGAIGTAKYEAARVAIPTVAPQ